MLFSLITCFASALGVFEKALTYFKSSAPELKEERAMLLESWLNMEVSFGELGDVSLVQSELPKKLKKRRPITTEDGPAGYVTNPLFTCFILFFFFFAVSEEAKSLITNNLLQSGTFKCYSILKNQSFQKPRWHNPFFVPLILFKAEFGHFISNPVGSLIMCMTCTCQFFHY